MSDPGGPLIIGLAGTIAAGKSTVAQLLVEEHGAVHCDGDKLVHRLYDPGTPGFDRVVAAFGDDIVGADGIIDRKVLGAKVFGKPEEMAKLTKAIGSITDAFKRQIGGWREELGPDDLAVIEAVNIMEAGYARWCDQTWLVGVDDDIARRRLMDTRGMSEEEANQRLASMRPFDQRAPGADWTYKNNGGLDEMRAAVNAEVTRIIALHRAGKLPESGFEPWWLKQTDNPRAREALREAGVLESEDAAEG